MTISSAWSLRRILPLFAALAASTAPALAAGGMPDAGPGSVSAGARAQLRVAFTTARAFRPRGDRLDYQVGRADAESALRDAEAAARSRTERLMAESIRSYLTARDACRLAATVNEYGTCEAQVSDKFGEPILARLDGVASR